MTTFEIAGMQWEGLPGSEHLIRQVLSADHETIKISRGKRVVRCQVDSTSYFVKFYLHHDFPLRPFKYRFKPSQARQEWETAQALQARGIPIVAHVALGERRNRLGLQESILVTEAFDGISLRYSSHWDAVALGRFVDLLHDAGVRHDDLHPSNILAHRTTGAFHLVDLYPIQLKHFLTEKERAHNKAFLAMHLPVPVSLDVFLLSRRLRWREMHKRARRCLRENQDFTSLEVGHLRWQVRRCRVRDEMEAIFRDPDRCFLQTGTMLKQGRSSTVARPVEGIVLKRYNFKKPLNYLKDFFRMSRAKRSFLLAYHLEITGVPTARGIATGDRRSPTGARRSWFMMEELAGAGHLSEWTGDRSRAISAAAKLVAKLHNEAFTHRDLKATNIMIHPEGKVYLIDLDGLRFKGKLLSAKEIMEDWRRLFRDGEKLLGITALEKCRFLRTYWRERHVKPKGLMAHLREMKTESRDVRETKAEKKPRTASAKA